MNEKYIIDMLTQHSVSVIKQRVMEFDGVEMNVGDPHRKAYINNEKGRLEVEQELPLPQASAIFSVWGKEATLP